MNATYNSTKSYVIKGKVKKKGAPAAEIWYQLNLAEALMKEIVVSNMILLAIVPKF